MLVLLVRVRESGFCWTIWIRFFYGCGGCAVYFGFSTFLVFQILYSTRKKSRRPTASPQYDAPDNPDDDEDLELRYGNLKTCLTGCYREMETRVTGVVLENINEARVCAGGRILHSLLGSNCTESYNLHLTVHRTGTRVFGFAR